jgi:hypothetical protein
MNKEQKELLSDAYNMFQKTCQFEEDANHILSDEWIVISDDFMNASILSQEEFTNKIKTDNEFAKQWGVVYEERKLSEDERLNLVPNKEVIIEAANNFANFEDRTVKDFLDELNVPTKSISITYNNKIIESYESR